MQPRPHQTVYKTGETVDDIQLFLFPHPTHHFIHSVILFRGKTTTLLVLPDLELTDAQQLCSLFASFLQFLNIFEVSISATHGGWTG